MTATTAPRISPSHRAQRWPASRPTSAMSPTGKAMTATTRPHPFSAPVIGAVFG